MAMVVEPVLRYHESGITGAGPGVWYGSDAVDGDRADWLRAPLGSLYFRKSSTGATLYLKSAKAGADDDWVPVAGSVANGSLINGIGSTSDPLTTSTANKNFLGYWVESTATTDGSDTRAMYLRLYLNGATTGGGESLRAFTTVGASIGTAHGAHVSLSFGASGAVSGQGIALRSTLHLKAGTATGTLAPLQAEIYLDAATSAPSTAHSLIRAIVAGDATNKAAVTNFLSLEGVQASAASSSVAHIVTTGAADETSNTRIKVLINGTAYWLLATSAAPSA